MTDPNAAVAHRFASACPTPAHFAVKATAGTSKVWTPFRWLRLLNVELAELARARSEFLRTGHTDLNRFLIVKVPVRSGKSWFVSEFFTAWWHGMFPDDPVIQTGHTATLAEGFSEHARDLVVAHGEENFGVRVSRSSSAKNLWRMAAPDHGQHIATGVGSPPTGSGGGLIVVDDPIKSSEEAYSGDYRDKLWRWFQMDIRTRLEPGGVMVVVSSQWHSDDLIGRLESNQRKFLANREQQKAPLEADAAYPELAGPLEEQHVDIWRVFDLPALAEPSQEEIAQPGFDREAWRDRMGRREGEALEPSRYPRPVLLALRDSPNGVGPVAFAALYQGRPTAEKGTLFDISQFKIVDAGEVPHPLEHYVVEFDLASTEKQQRNDPDWTAAVLMGRHLDGRTYVLNADRVRSEDPSSWMRLFCQLAEAQLGFRPTVRMPQDPGQAGKRLFALYRDVIMPDFGIEEADETGDKMVRARPMASVQRGGHVYLVQGPWNGDFIDEHRNFPRAGAHDDWVDAASNAFSWLAGLSVNRLRVLA